MVRVKNHKLKCCSGNCRSWVEDQKEIFSSLIGHAGRIVSINYHGGWNPNNNYYYTTDIDDGKYAWSECMLESYLHKFKKGDIIVGVNPQYYQAVYRVLVYIPYSNSVWLKPIMNLLPWHNKPFNHVDPNGIFNSDDSNFKHCNVNL